MRLVGETGRVQKGICCYRSLSFRAPVTGSERGLICEKAKSYPRLNRRRPADMEVLDVVMDDEWRLGEHHTKTFDYQSQLRSTSIEGGWRPESSNRRANSGRNKELFSSFLRVVSFVAHQVEAIERFIGCCVF